MDFVLENIVSLKYFKPELAVCIGILAVFMADLFFGRVRWLKIFLAYLTILVSAVFLILQNAQGLEQSIFNWLLLVDSFAIFFKFIFLILASIIILIILKSKEFEGAGLSEIIIFIFTATLGMMMLASAGDLLMIYLSMESISLLSYVLVGYKIDHKPSSEAALKYIIFGGVASGIMLFGLSYLFGMFGTTNFYEIKNLLNVVSVDEYNLPVLFAILLTLTGLGFKIAMVPFHMWCPDVYEGAPTPVTAFLSVGPKAAGFAVLIRFIFTVFGDDKGHFIAIFDYIKMPQIIIFLSIVTMTLGNLAAIPQKNLKRLLAYSSIAHAGYMLMGLATFSKEGIEAILFYFPIYLFMNIGAFLIIIVVRDKTGSEEIEAYKGLGKKNPFLSFSLAVFLFSLIGLPPLAGFLGKFYIFAAVIHKGLYVLAAIGVLNSVISLFYYMRIAKAMFLEASRDAVQDKNNFSPVTANNLYHILNVIFLAGNLLLIFYWSPLLKIVKNSRLINF